MSRFTLFAGITTVMAAALAANAQVVRTGPSSSDTPYSIPAPGSPVREVVSIITVGDEIDGYVFVGIPDGMGGYMAGENQMSVFVIHEFGATAGGAQHAHQPKGFAGGAFISQWNVATAPGADFLKVLSGRDAMTSVATLTNGSGGSLYNFARFCSGDVPAVNALFNPATGKGTENRFFTCGEESGATGRMIATDLFTGVGYQMPAFDASQGAWENGLARPFASDTTVMIGTSDGAANRVFVYVGEKSDTGNSAERAGLLNGISHGIQVQVDGSDVVSESIEYCFGNAKTGPIYGGTFVLAEGGTAAGTSFLRPEDGAWDPMNPADFYFVCTNRMNTDTQIGRSRLFRLRFNDVDNVLAGGTIEALLDGTEVMEMGDQVAVYNDLQGNTRVMLQEDPGSSEQNAKTLMYSVATDELEIVLMSDPARFGDYGVPATAPFNTNEENSGIYDARDYLGMGWFIANMQAHYNLANPLVQGGQLYAFYCPECVGSCAADVAQPLDGQIDAEDLTTLLAAWGQAGATDLDQDGTTDSADLTILLSSWGACQ